MRRRLRSTSCRPTRSANASMRSTARPSSTIGQFPRQRSALSSEMPFFRDQRKIVLENSGAIDPNASQEYIAAGGYEALLTCLTAKNRQDIVLEVIESGRGAVAARVSDWPKRSTVAKAGDSRPKYVICNADEGDPGAFMDRACWKAIRIGYWKAWPLPPTQLGPARLHILPRGISPGRQSVCGPQSGRQKISALLGNNICRNHL